MIRKLVLLTCLLLCGQLAHAAKPSVRMLDFGEVPVSVFDNQEPTLDQVKKDVIMAGLRLGWELQSSTASEVNLRYAKRDYAVDIRVKYTTKMIKVEYVDSNGLGYEKRDNGAVVIHPSYNRWISNLLKSISPLGQQLRLKTALSTPPVAEDSIAIHYHRNDMDYANWGLHIWGPAFETRTSWFRPIMLTGMDAFGAVYIVKAAKPAEGETEAFFLLHNGEIKDKCSQDQSWDASKAREIFMVSGDCKIYFTADEAVKSSAFR